MTAKDVIEFVKLCELHNVDVCIDGGWGIDALLGEQTRPHSDLDVAIPHKDAALVRELLEVQGYTEVPRDDSWECNFVLGDDLGHVVDIHTYTIDEEHKNIFGVAYPYDSLTGHGLVDGHPVRCIPAEWMVKFHTGYQLDENDYRDIKHLCVRFGIEMPHAYEEFEKRERDLAKGERVDQGNQ